MRSPRPIRAMAIGDSWSEGGTPTWMNTFQANTGIVTTQFAQSAKCLVDTGGALGTDTIRLTIDADLADPLNVDADFVLWATCAAADILRRKQNISTTTSAELLVASAYVLDAIKAAKKTAIVCCCTWFQSLIWNNGVDGSTVQSSQDAYLIRTEFNTGLRAQCEARGFVYYEPKWMWADLGPITVADNGLYPQYYQGDFSHPSTQGAAGMAFDFAGMVKMMPRRKAA